MDSSLDCLDICLKQQIKILNALTHIVMKSRKPSKAERRDLGKTFSCSKSFFLDSKIVYAKLIYRAVQQTSGNGPEMKSSGRYYIGIGNITHVNVYKENRKSKIVYV